MLRKLTKTEKFYWLSNQKNPFNMCIAVQFEGSIEKSILEQSLKRIQQCHPFLNVAIDDSEEPCFIHASTKIPLSFKSKTDEEEWQFEVHKELHTPFEYRSGPLIRVSYLQGKTSNELLLTLDHLIADGVSCLHLVHEIFSTVEKIVNREPLSLKISHSCPRSLEEIASATQPLPSTSLIDEEIFRLNPDLESCGKIGNSSQSGIIFSSLPEAETQTFLNLCKENKTTFQGGLFAAGAKALLEKINNESSDSLANISMKFHCPVNLRPYLPHPVPLGDLGSFIGILSFDQQLNKSDDFWDLARKTRERLSFELNADLPRKTIEGMSSLVDHNDSYDELREARKWIGPLIGVSNVGKIDFPHSFGSVQIKNIYPVVALHGMFFNENNIYITALTFQNQMNIGFIYPKSLLNCFKAKELSKKIVANLSMISDLSLV